MELKHLKGFVSYVPSSPLPSDFPLENINDPNISDLCRRHHLAELANTRSENGMKPLFEHDQYGLCWYDAILGFNAKTTKIIYDADTGRVISFNVDASKLFPHGNNVIEVDKLPEGFKADTWKVNENGHLVEHNAEVIRLNSVKQTRLLIAACAHLVALQVMPDKTDSELVQLQALNEYVIGVKRTDVSALEPEWPTSPI